MPRRRRRLDNVLVETASQMSGLPEIRKIADLARRSIEPGLLPGSDGTGQSEGACLYASLVAFALVKRFGHGVPTIRGGRAGEGGCRDLTGAWRGHYWVEVRSTSGVELVLDITADQFGYEPVVVIPLEGSQTRYRPGRQLEVDLAFQDLARELNWTGLINT